MPWCPCKGSTACFLPHVAERLLQADASKGFLSSFASDWFVFKSAILWLLAADPPREMKRTVWKAKRVSLAAFQRLVCWLTTGCTWSECRAAPKTHVNRNILYRVSSMKQLYTACTLSHMHNCNAEVWRSISTDWYWWFTPEWNWKHV